MTDTAKERIEKELKEKTGILYLNNCELDHIPKVVGEMIHLTTLSLSRNRISKIEGLSRLRNLNRLELNGNQISKLEGLNELTNLTHLGLYSNQITKIEGLNKVINLTRLSLSYNEISKLEGLDKLINLTSLGISDNQIRKIEGLSGLDSLIWLYLDSNQISKLEGLERLSNLYNLQLFDNQINKLEGLDELINLNELDLSINQISKLEGLGRLTSLTKLHVNSNAINKLEGLDGLTSLNKLYLNSNAINKLEGLGRLTSLTSLHLTSNAISKLEGLDGLTSLTSLSLVGNAISKLEGLDGLTNLTSLALSRNAINKLEGLDELTSLTTLYLSSNQINKIEGLDGLTNLTALFLQHNKITQIGGLLSLINLKILDFESNPITDFPTEYQAFLSSIPFLDLKATKIKNLIYFYKNIEQGRRILWKDIEHRQGDVNNNRDYVQFIENEKTYHVERGINVKNCTELEPGLVAAIETGQDAILAYIKEPKERLFEARVLVLGEPRAGKTTLRRKLMNVSNSMPSPKESTKAFEIEIEPNKCNIEILGQKEELSYYLWDFGGQDYYRLLHQLFVTEQSVYIIVVDTDRNKNEEEISFWLDTIERLGKDERHRYGPVILFQNPKNNRPGREFNDLKKRYSFWQQTENFVINLNALNEKESDSFDKNQLESFKAFKKYLGRSFCQLDHVGKDIPIKWINVREALLEEQENWISIERFNIICIQNEINEKVQRTDLLNIFRQLGYLLHYKNSALKGMVILNRDWITDALYRVLDDPIVDSNKGWFLKEDAEKIWYEEKYVNRTEELLVLMEEFKLCYQNQTTKKYIVPSKLPSSVGNLPEWNSADNVRLRLKYDWMPKAIAIQLLVSLHEYIASFANGEQWIWRQGAVLNGNQLELEGVQIRVRDEYDNKQIAIDARGPHSEILFRVIMKKWKEVNEPFADKVKVTSIILCHCATCAKLDIPHSFRYQSVLNAKQKKQTLQCNESFIGFKAEDILKGVYDETTVLLDSLKIEKEMPSSALDLIRADELDKAIAKIASPAFNAVFERRLKEWDKNSHLKSVSFEQKTQSRNSLAKDLVGYFTSDRWQEQYKLEHKHDMFSAERIAFIDESDLEINTIHENVPVNEGIPFVQVNITNTQGQNPSVLSEEDNGNNNSENDTQTIVSLPIYKQWWFSRIIGSVILGCIVGYFANKYFKLHYGDAWLAVTSLFTILFLMRNPKRVYLRWAGFCVMAIAGINILSQIDIAFNITGAKDEPNPWDFIFKLGFGEEPIISVILGVLAGGLFVLDYRVRKEKL